MSNNDIGFGVNLATALLFSALMQHHRRDWELQVRFAEKLVESQLRKVPLSLLPAHSVTMDSFVAPGS
eukprot:2096520-Rhodomonas_salina.1